MNDQPTPLLIALAAELVRARVARGWTQQAFAKRLGVSRRTVQHLENGDPGVKVGTVLAAIALLGVEPLRVLASPFGAYRLDRPVRRRVRPAAAVDDPLDF